jgi:hypothetical protein
MVRRNREILSRLIDAVFFLAKQELSFRGRDGAAKSLNKENYVEFLLYTADYDPVLDNLSPSVV